MHELWHTLNKTFAKVATNYDIYRAASKVSSETGPPGTQLQVAHPTQSFGLNSHMKPPMHPRRTLSSVRWICRVQL